MEIVLSRFAELLSGAAGWPLTVYLYLAQLIVGLALAVIWLRLQPQGYFLHLSGFSALLLLYSVAALLPSRFILHYLAYLRFARYTLIVFHLNLLLWLATAPLDFGFKKPQTTIRTLVRKRLWLASFSLVTVLAAMGIDASGLWLPVTDFDFYLWLIPTLLLIFLALTLASRKLIGVLSEYFTYLTAFCLFILASYTHLFMDLRLALIPALLASVLLIFLILLYHKHFFQTESDIRESLFQENVQLRQQGEIHRRVLDSVTQAMAVVDLDEKLLYANNAFRQLFGLQDQDPAGRTLSKVIGRDAHQALQPAMKDAELRRTGSAEFRRKADSGAQKENRFLVQIQPVLNPRNRLQGFQLVFIELTDLLEKLDRIRSEAQTLDHQLRRHHQILDADENAVVMTDLQGRPFFTSRSLERLISRLEAPAGIDGLFVSAAEYRRFLAEVREGRPRKKQVEWRSSTGAALSVDVLGYPLRNKNGEVDAIAWIIRDARPVNELNARLEQANTRIAELQDHIHRLEQHHLNLLNSLDTGLVLVRANGACRLLNRKASELLGIESGEIALHHLPNFVQDILRMTANYSEKLQTQHTEFVDTYKRRDGSSRALRWRAIPLPDPDGRQFDILLHIEDYSEIQEHQARIEALQNEVDRYRTSRDNQAAVILDQYRHLLRFLVDAPSLKTARALMDRLAKTIKELGWEAMAVYHFEAEKDQFTLFRCTGLNRQKQRRVQTLSRRDIAACTQPAFSAGDGFLLHGEALESLHQTPLAELVHSGQALFLAPLPAEGPPLGLMLVLLQADRAASKPEMTEICTVMATQVARALRLRLAEKSLPPPLESDALLQKLNRLIDFNQAFEDQLRNVLQELVSALGCRILFLQDHPRPEAYVAEKVNKKVSIRSISEADTSRELRSLLLEEDYIPDKIIFLEGERSGRLLNRLNVSPVAETSWAVVRILIRGRQPFGALCFIQDRALPEPAARETYRSIAEQVGWMLENRLLFEEIETKARELERSNNRTIEFLSSISHDLRTPLNAILSNARALQENKASLSGESRHFVEIIQNSGNHLLHLIDNLLDMKMYESGNVSPRPRVFAVDSFLKEIEKEIGPLCQNKALAFRCEKSPQVPNYIKTDRGMLYRILINLLHNAQKFTEQGEVSLTLTWKAPQTLCIRVADTGIGIPPSMLEVIFKPFYQLHPDHAGRKGKGLGLAIASKLVDSLDGTIEVNSRPGEGTVFEVQIPVQPSRRSSKSKSKQPARRKSPGLLRRTRNILLIDDDLSTREAMKYLLEKNGFHVEFAGDGRSAIAEAQRLRPDLILLDIMLPDTSGYDIARTLKGQKRLKHTPIIALTARTMPEDRDRARKAGCDDFLTKPFDWDDFLQVVEKYI